MFVEDGLGVISPANNLVSLIAVRSIRSSPPEVFLGKGVLKICNKYTRENLCRSVILIKLLCNFIEITLRHGCSPVNLLDIFRTSSSKNTSGRLLQIYQCQIYMINSIIRLIKIILTGLRICIWHWRYAIISLFEKS